jgi:hypothetical protein
MFVPSDQFLSFWGKRIQFARAHSTPGRDVRRCSTTLIATLIQLKNKNLNIFPRETLLSWPPKLDKLAGAGSQSVDW